MDWSPGARKKAETPWTALLHMWQHITFECVHTLNIGPGLRHYPFDFVRKQFVLCIFADAFAVRNVKIGLARYTCKQKSPNKHPDTQAHCHIRRGMPIRGGGEGGVGWGGRSSTCT